MVLDKLVKIPIREIYKLEAKDFTQWLEDNIDALNEQLGFSLSSPKREQNAGSFSVDIIAEDEEGDAVIIENQLEKTDHDHLGKLLTYVTNIDAKTAIWICTEPRYEHIKVINWLNEVSSDASFYLIKLEGVRIGDKESPLFTIICKPSEEAREIGEKNDELAERHIKRIKFWTGLLDMCKEKTKLHSGVSPGKYSWIGAGAGMAGLTYNYQITNDSASSDLYIDRGKDSEKENKKIFGELYSKKDEIERDFGGALSWDRLDEKRASRIRVRFEGIGLRDDEEKWGILQSKLIDAMIRLEKALGKHITELER